MIKLYFYYGMYEQVSEYGERRYEKGEENIGDNWDNTDGDLKLSDFGYDEEVLKEEANNNDNFRNGDGYELILHRVTSAYENEEDLANDKLCGNEVDEIVDHMLICKNLPYYFVRRYYDSDDDEVKAVKAKTSETPGEEEARKESGIENDAFDVVVLKTYDGAHDDEEEQVGSDYYPITEQGKQNKRAEIISELRKLSDKLSALNRDLDSLVDEADEVDKELGKKLDRAYLSAEELLNNLDDID